MSCFNFRYTQQGIGNVIITAVSGLIEIKIHLAHFQCIEPVQPSYQVLLSMYFTYFTLIFHRYNLE